GFAMFVMGGNIFLGLVVFGVIMIVNFMVITKGAGRMAEVGARFALDAMPGKQLAIDSDVAAGAISHEEARERRQREQEETTFFGSLDGASKFVKGDAIAGLLITLLNLVVGVGVGVGVHNLSVGAAIETYSILTVGDGLVTQIPAVIISVAAALLLSKGGAAGAADKILSRQLLAHPAALYAVAAALGCFAVVPGLPFLPFMAAALAFAGVAYRLQGIRRRAATPPAENAPAPVAEKSLGDLMNLDEIQVEFASDLVPLALDMATGLDTRVAKIRNHVAAEFGFVVPPIRLNDNADLEPGEYVIWIHGVESARFRLRAGCVLILAEEDEVFPFDGAPVEEPVYGASARWIAAQHREAAASLGCPVIEPPEILATHLLETIKGNFGRLMTRRAVRKILDEFVKTSDPARSAANRQIVDEFIPDKVPIEIVQSVFRILLEEAVSIRNIPVILEAAAEARPWCQSADKMAEHVRRRLSRQITASLKTELGQVPLVQLSPEWEAVFSRHETTNEAQEKEVALPPEEFNRLARSISDQLRKAAANKLFPAVVTFRERRRFIRDVLHAKGIRNPVIAYDELDTQAKPLLVGAA
ncbi:MAG: FHIPEP family type III secretion protein, partial [Parvularculaceae bacterium]|nr:FHIPEP family type III secretion protein [Parvularculaceae bacterium]